MPPTGAAGGCQAELTEMEYTPAGSVNRVLSGGGGTTVVGGAVDVVEPAAPPVVGEGARPWLAGGLDSWPSTEIDRTMMTAMATAMAAPIEAHDSQARPGSAAGGVPGAPYPVLGVP